MLFPFVVLNDVEDDVKETWCKFYNRPQAYDYRIHEGVWRRTQEECNKASSGWRDEHDARRRLLQFRHHFEMTEDQLGRSALCIARSYLWLHYRLPAQELEQLRTAVSNALLRSGWSPEPDSELARWSLGSLCLTISEGTREGAYGAVEYELMTHDYNPTQEFRNRPWDILRTGFRKTLSPQSTTRFRDLCDVEALFPAHVELGCGPSIEAGIPPLHDLHRTYRVIDPHSKRFIWSWPEDDLLVSLIENPIATYLKFASHFVSCLRSKPSEFYTGLAQLVAHGDIIEPVINNNFDGLPRRVGLKERCIRRFEESEIVPDIEFHPQAKALFVFGCHADRRRVQEAARQRGLKVVHIDPEGFHIDGNFYPYPLEAPQAADMVVNQPAGHAIKQMLASRTFL